MRYRTMVTFALGMVLTMGLVACGAAGDDDDSPTGGSALLDRAGDDDGRDDLAASPESPRGVGANSSALLDRKIIFTATLELEAENVRSSFESAGLIARRVGGFVERSSLSTRDSTDGQTLTYATITLRVPVDEYDSVLNDLRTLNGVEVVNEDSSSTEVTEEYTDLQSRLRNLERTEAQYLTLLERATTIDDILTVNDRLDGVRLQIEEILGRLNLLDDLTDLATVSVSLSPILAPPVVADQGSGIPTFAETLEGALAFSFGALQVLAAGSAIVLVAMAWLAVPGLVYVGARYVQRRGPANS